MKYPLDSSDEASLILADFLEEYNDINLANEVRNSVLEPNNNVWCYEFYCCSFIGNHGVVGRFGDVGGIGDVGSVFGDVVGVDNYFDDDVGG